MTCPLPQVIAELRHPEVPARKQIATQMQRLVHGPRRMIGHDADGCLASARFFSARRFETRQVAISRKLS